MHPVRLKYLWMFVLLIGLLRLVSLATYPLMDTTEARYGEIARIMLETGNWLVPHIDYDVPFWGKPPLSIWASALSIAAFTNSEFFLRVPHFLAALATLLVVWKFVLAAGFDRAGAAVAVAVIATTTGFLITAGAVMTDMFLCLAMTLATTGFWRAWHGERLQAHLMFAGLGLGLLAKGPLILVLAALVIAPWMIRYHGFAGSWREIHRRLYPASGILLMLAIAAPWYLLAEMASPGFLEYFLVGEHIKRFLVSGWEGDLYGSAHAQPRGMIWLYWVVFALPWSALLVAALVRKSWRRRNALTGDPLTLFLVLWVCAPMLLFTLAGNILPAYIVPGLPALGPLVVKHIDSRLYYRGRLLLLVGPLLVLALVVLVHTYGAEMRSDKELLATGIDAPYPIYYCDRLPYSARYYTGGTARHTQDLPVGEIFYLVTRLRSARVAAGANCELRAQNRKRTLFLCAGDPRLETAVPAAACTP